VAGGCAWTGLQVLLAHGHWLVLDACRGHIEIILTGLMRESMHAPCCMGLPPLTRQMRQRLTVPVFRWSPPNDENHPNNISRVSSCFLCTVPVGTCLIHARPTLEGPNSFGGSHPAKRTEGLPGAWDILAKHTGADTAWEH
jgi:hypothetical protein